MKHIYTVTCVSILLLTLGLSPNLQAQCSTCPGGGEISYTVILDTTTDAFTYLSFPQFDPSVGVLTCIALHDTISLISTTGMRNNSGTQTLYRFRLNVNTMVLGPPSYVDMFTNNDVTRNYAAILLEPKGTPGDSITYGPDTMFYDQPNEASLTGRAAYIGNGNVNLQFTIGGGVTATGSVAYTSTVDTRVWGKFRLTYYWCPPTILTIPNLGNFTAVKKGNTIQVEWYVNDEEKSNNYEVEISYDGRNFIPAGKAAGQYAAAGTAAKYSYQYLPDPAAAGKLYVRIRQTNAQGKVSYSPIRTVTLDNAPAPSFVVSPNPVKDKLTLRFDRELKGQYGVELFNTAGQTLLNRTLTANGTSSLDIPLPVKPPPGMYYLRTTSLLTGQLHTSKLLVR
ncbi:MAG: choice-of-anchor E domain-containing protein [Candidatus Pseudobacter hemicellulosilyticus]|uniref:Choice-of-anchor E domain-containing protein n=1 Tax=Candidatus Pseudobacter hemicellulosilyticus TaxID=3121375 RepID=A0AAJ6BIA8_9BACT|nr:MAG: choice-of-anchor E domain-containing protein [Pseudobacter sp.]